MNPSINAFKELKRVSVAHLELVTSKSCQSLRLFGKEMPNVHQQMIHLVLRIFKELKQVPVAHLERVINKICESPLVFERKRRTRINKS